MPKLTAAFVENARPDLARREIPDALVPGLYFVVQPSGKKSWAARYRVHGRTRKLTLGPYPTLDLGKAREAAREAIIEAQKGNDLALAKKATKTDDSRTFSKAVETFIKRHAKPENRSWEETARLLGYRPDFETIPNSLIDKWGHRPVAEISRAEVIAWLDKIVDRGAPVVANRTLAAVRKFFNWCVARDLIGASPCAGIAPPVAEQARDRVLTDDELRAFWKATGQMGYPFGNMFRLLLLTGQRRDEVAGMTWSELDLDGQTWTLPRERVKTDRAHEVPLSPQSLAQLATVKKIGDQYVFTKSGETAVSGFSKAKARLDLLMECQTPWRLHDLRRTAASGMARLGIALPVIERLLNHQSGSFAGIVGVYQRHDFADEKRAAMIAWGEFVDGL